MSENLPGSHAAVNHPPTENVAAEPRQADPTHGKPSEVFQTFLKIGLTAFGGPIAHLGYFEREIIERRNWLTQNAYGDLVALCQFLPGPASSQVAFALGYLRAGIGGAFAAIAGFTVPSAALMIAIAYGFQAISSQSGFLHGLKLAAVAVVAQAVWTMAVKLCTDRERVTFALLAACVVLGSSIAWLQVVVLAAGALFGWIFLRENAGSGEIIPAQRGLHGGWFAWANTALYFLLLAGLPLLSALFQEHWLQLADAFYRSGALVFGGGHVVLPLLQSQTVSRGWLDQNTFLAGYGAAQAMPGPLFTFSAYLGTVIGHNWLAGVWCLVWIFLPSFLLLLGVLPFWSSLRQNAGAQAALRGANAAMVGILARAQDAASSAPSATPSPAPATYSSCHVDGPYIAITFDDGPSPGNTTRLLDILKQRNIKVTFFMIGPNVVAHPEIARRVLAEGHEIGNHSWTHPQLSKLSDQRVTQEITKTQEAIKNACGFTPTLLRPPYGAITKSQREWIEKQFGLNVILWSVDPLDWKRPGASAITQRILSGAQPGALILSHDIHPQTVDAMSATLDALLAKGYKFVTVSQLIAMNHPKAPSPPAAVTRTPQQ